MANTRKVQFRGDAHSMEVRVERDDLLVIAVDGRDLVGLSLTTGCVGVWAADADPSDNWREVWCFPEVANTDSVPSI